MTENQHRGGQVEFPWPQITGKPPPVEQFGSVSPILVGLSSRPNQHSASNSPHLSPNTELVREQQNISARQTPNPPATSPLSFVGNLDRRPVSGDFERFLDTRSRSCQRQYCPDPLQGFYHPSRQTQQQKSPHAIHGVSPIQVPLSQSLQPGHFQPQYSRLRASHSMGHLSQQQISPPKPYQQQQRGSLRRHLSSSLIGRARGNHGFTSESESGNSAKNGRNSANERKTRSKKSLNVDSPAFTPATLSVPIKTSTISSQAANAAPFTPRGLISGTSTPQPEVEAPPIFDPARIREFTPAQNFDPAQTISNGATNDPQVSYDPFSMNTIHQAIPATAYNPYLEDTTNAATNGNAFYPGQTTFSSPAQPLQYHLYAPIGPHREDLLAYQRLAHDFFIPNDLREELQKKSEASRQVMHNSQLPIVDHYHTLVPLDTNHNKSATVFGFPSWVYKAISSKNGKFYVLRRLEGFRLSNERAIRTVKEWRRVDNGGVVSVIDAFTTRAFGDSSLIFVYDYFPMSKTLVEHHFTSTNRFGNRSPNTVIPEQVLWSYIVQLTSAIKSVHETKLAVRCMDVSKVLLTEKNRVRLNACSVLDVVNFEANRPLADLQQEDFVHFGKLILALATNNLSPNIPVKSSVDNLTRTYTAEFKETITWLLTPAQAPATKDLEEFLRGISKHIIASYDSALHAKDDLTSTLSRELENGRLFRLMAKLGTINERPEYEGTEKWSDTGDRYVLKLFRDYVFHRVGPEGKPVVDLGHILTCLNKLDAGVAEQMQLVSRDEQDVMIVSYREIKKQVEAAFSELVKQGQGKRF